MVRGKSSIGRHTTYWGYLSQVDTQTVFGCLRCWRLGLRLTRSARIRLRLPLSIPRLGSRRARQRGAGIGGAVLLGLRGSRSSITASQLWPHSSGSKAGTSTGAPVSILSVRSSIKTFSVTSWPRQSSGTGAAGKSPGVTAPSSTVFPFLRGIVLSGGTGFLWYDFRLNPNLVGGAVPLLALRSRPSIKAWRYRVACLSSPSCRASD